MIHAIGPLGDPHDWTREDRLNDYHDRGTCGAVEQYLNRRSVGRGAGTGVSTGKEAIATEPSSAVAAGFPFRSRDEHSTHPHRKET